MTDIPRGYKQIEVGVIPEDWEAVELGGHSEITKLAGFEYSSHFNSYKDGGDIIVIRGTNITHNSLDLSDVKTIPRSTSDKLPRSKLKVGDLVFAYVGTIGPVFLIDKNNSYHLGPNTARITCKVGLSPDFLFCYFRSDLIRKEITERISTGAQPSLSMTKIRAFRILKPTKAEQEAIAEALSDADALIDSLEQLIAKKRHLKQGAMQELLTGKKRLQEFSGEWEVKTFGDVFDITAGGDVDPRETISYQDQIHCYPIYSNALRDFGLYGYCTYADHPTGSITVTARGTLGFANFRDHAYTAIGRVLVLQSKQETDGRFFAEFINNRIKFAVESTGVPQLTAPQISAYRLAVPPFLEQEAIATILYDMDVEIVALETKLAKTRSLKQGMMHNLLTGKVRLVDTREVGE